MARDCVRGTQRDAVATRFRQDVSNYALYGQLTLNVTEQLRVTGGLRWTDSNKEGSFLSLVNNPISAPPSPANPFALDLRIPEQHPDLEYDEEEITWLANISYSPVENLMLFATYATGFRSGGFNPEGFDSVAEAAGADRVYDTETVDNIEVGAKGGMFDNRVVVNLNYFHTEIDDLQDRRFDGVNFLMQNVEELTQQGVELDIQARPVDQLYTVLGVSYLDSSFGNFPQRHQPARRHCRLPDLGPVEQVPGVPPDGAAGPGPDGRQEPLLAAMAVIARGRMVRPYPRSRPGLVRSG